MREDCIKIRLHEASAIKKFINITRGFNSDIDIMTDRAVVDAKSIIGLYALNLSDDTYVKIISDDAEEIKNFNAAMEEFK